ncbi:MAG: diaminopimelate epimerase [Clostridia bacterium]|nr:diaminopimelate epimerase [Clostridia bacterium]
MILFTKMQGCGNDYVYINNDIERIQDMSGFTKFVSSRNFCIGSDGCIFIFKDDNADVAFRIFNPDGSEASMCGNGIRCVAKYVYEKDIVKKKRMTINTKSGIKNVELYVEDGVVKNVKVNMGVPIFSTKMLDIDYPKDVLINEPFDIEDARLYLTCLYVGNIHTVLFVDNVNNIDIEKYGKSIENMSIFKDRTNVEFVEIIDRENIKVRVWERGVGETLACGTGATASVIAGFLTGVTENICKVKLRGGELEIVYNEMNNELSMIGTAEFVYEGKLYTK